jgi:hypothetical protein
VPTKVPSSSDASRDMLYRSPAGPVSADADVDSRAVLVPTPMAGLSNITIVAVSCGSRHTLALDDQVGGGQIRRSRASERRPRSSMRDRSLTRRPPRTPPAGRALQLGLGALRAVGPRGLPDCRQLPTHHHGARTRESGVTHARREGDFCRRDPLWGRGPRRCEGHACLALPLLGGGSSAKTGCVRAAVLWSGGWPPHVHVHADRTLDTPRLLAGHVWTWGECSYGQLGHGHETLRGNCKGLPDKVMHSDDVSENLTAAPLHHRFLPSSVHLRRNPEGPCPPPRLCHACCCSLWVRRPRPSRSLVCSILRP